MTPEFPTDPRQALEVSLTAMLLGELPEDQAAFLRQAIAHDAELAKTYERLKQTIELVRETEKAPITEMPAHPEPLALGQERRQELLQSFKTVAPREFAEAPRRKVSWLLPVAAAAVLMLVAAGALLPALSRSKSRSMSYAYRGFRAPESASAVITTADQPAQRKGSLSPQNRQSATSGFALRESGAAQGEVPAS